MYYPVSITTDGRLFSAGEDSKAFEENLINPTKSLKIRSNTSQSNKKKKHTRAARSICQLLVSIVNLCARLHNL